MKSHTRSILHTLRLLGFGEAFSWLLLLFFAMPMKYLYGQPQAVKIVGWIHGILFICYVFQLLRVKILLQWPFSRLVYGTVAAFLPFGTLVFDRQLKQEEQKFS